MLTADLCGSVSDAPILASIRCGRLAPRHRSVALPNVVAALPATRLTPDVARRSAALVGRVRSVHRAAFYVDIAAADGLLTVALDDVGGVPGGILVGGISDWRALGIVAGMTFVGTPDGWSIPAARVTISSSTARLWSAALPDRPGVKAIAPSTIAAARRATLRRAAGGGLAPLLAGEDDAGDAWLARAREVARREHSLVDLIGLGPGLTPSGDDFLVGYLAGLDAAADPARPALAAGIVEAAPARTTAISASMLRHAAGGEYAERLHEVVGALCTGRADRITRAVDRAMAYGATSGVDTVVGLFAALERVAAERAAAEPDAASRFAA